MHKGWVEWYCNITTGAHRIRYAAKTCRAPYLVFPMPSPTTRTKPHEKDKPQFGPRCTALRGVSRGLPGRSPTLIHLVLYRGLITMGCVTELELNVVCARSNILLPGPSARVLFPMFVRSSSASLVCPSVDFGNPSSAPTKWQLALKGATPAGASGVECPFQRSVLSSWEANTGTRWYRRCIYKVWIITLADTPGFTLDRHILDGSASRYITQRRK